MTELPIGGRTRPESSTTFFACLAALCVLLAFGGFTPTYFLPMSSGTLRELSPAVHIHGGLFFGWTILLLAQSSLIVRRRIALHRSIGLFSIAWVSAMVIFGVMVNLAANGARIEAGEVDRGYALGLSGIVSALSFGALFGVAVRNVKRSEHHRRWMLFATTLILPAAVARLYFPFFGFGETPTWLTVATVNIVPFACVVYDLRVSGRLHPATVIGVPTILALQVVGRTLDGTSAWRAIYDGLLTLTGA